MPRTDMPIRVAVVSRNHLIRAGLVALIGQLEARAVVTEAISVDHALEPHDVAIYDLGAVKDADAYDDLRRLLDHGIQVIGLVYDAEKDTVSPAAEATAHVITLSVTADQLLDVLRRTTPAREPGGSVKNEMRLPAGLSEQEFRIIEHVGAGLPNRYIATEMHLTVNSVKTYIRSAYQKIGVTDRAGAVRWAGEHGLVGGPDRR